MINWLVIIVISIQRQIITTSIKSKWASAWGSGCGSVGRVVAPDTKDQQFESQHKDKETGKSSSLKKTLHMALKEISFQEW